MGCELSKPIPRYVGEEMLCEYKSRDLERCENEEVICYIYRGYSAGGLSCQFKDAWAHEVVK
jgi:hypothetical protein